MKNSCENDRKLLFGFHRTVTISLSLILNSSKQYTGKISKWNIHLSSFNSFKFYKVVSTHIIFIYFGIQNIKVFFHVFSCIVYGIYLSEKILRISQMVNWVSKWTWKTRCESALCGNLFISVNLPQIHKRCLSSTDIKIYFNWHIVTNSK